MLDHVHELMVTSETFCLPVVNEREEFIGLVSNSDIVRIHPPERKNVKVAAVYTREVKSAYPDQTVHEIAEQMRMNRLANFPVLARQNTRRFIGMITKSEIVRAYQRMAIETAVVQ